MKPVYSGAITGRKKYVSDASDAAFNEICSCLEKIGLKQLDAFQGAGIVVERFDYPNKGFVHIEEKTRNHIGLWEISVNATWHGREGEEEDVKIIIEASYRDHGFKKAEEEVEEDREVG